MNHHKSQSRSHLSMTCSMGCLGAAGSGEGCLRGGSMAAAMDADRAAADCAGGISHRTQYQRK